MAHPSLEPEEVAIETEHFLIEDSNHRTIGCNGIVGLVTGVGSNVQGRKVGDKVVGLVKGAVTNHVVVEGHLTVSTAGTKNDVGVPIVVSIMVLLTELLRARPGETILFVNGGGAQWVQACVAAALGLRVFVMPGERAASYPTRPDLTFVESFDEVSSLTSGLGVRHCVVPSSSPNLTSVVPVIAPTGSITLCPSTSPPPSSVMACLLQKSCSLHFYDFSTWVSSPVASGEICHILREAVRYLSRDEPIHTVLKNCSTLKQATVEAEGSTQPVIGKIG
eukprot:TRINITY_DN1640_c0_g2_i1.p1 TRINITY_DN1640_c0_g2~~TRINITY_DN1640_c0_g2_i1.p1  ORF type:complete len:278 (+),score=23.94 TRINITY_DN1640_c0_g2_i1:305-1138(+)